MKEMLAEVRAAMRTLDENAEVLPAVGGALEELERPDAEERVEMMLGKDEKLFESGWESDRSQLYRSLEPLPRTEKHLFRYFQDGSYRSYFLGNLLEHDRETPVLFAQVGACQLQRDDAGQVKPTSGKVKSLLLLAFDQVSDSLQRALLQTVQAQQQIEVLNISEPDELAGRGAADLRLHALNKVRLQMHSLELEMASNLLPQLGKEEWLVIDGSLQFKPLLDQFHEGDPMPRVIGVAKSFRKDPKFTVGQGARAERRSLYRLLADLGPRQRTLAFGARDGKIVFWYLRLRPQGQLDYPLMGVIKLELINPSRRAVPSELIDELSRALIAERNVTPHGVDRRWHAHLYPIFLAEQYIKQQLISREVIRHALQWR